ncbi:MAG TPA: DUF4350 domain-containing protein [Pyrinomonadaceae bacterium]|nr:DUF4350 domain-containing protein [Pyrinomonadaceae bacterium]
MRQRLTIILTFVVIIGALVILNTLTHVQEEKAAGDTEFNANRSTYHSGPTGTRALHDFLNESGYKVMRWREATEELLKEHGKMVSTFVVVGETRIPFEDDEYALLRRWVSLGGRLVIIDRSPPASFMSTWGWTMSTRELAFPALNTNPGDVKQMTQDVTEMKPVQPTLLTDNVAAVMPSRFASRLIITPDPEKSVPVTGIGIGIGPGVGPPPPVRSGTPEEIPEETPAEEPPPPAASPTVSIIDETGEGEEEDEIAVTAPVAHIADRDGAIVVDYVYGGGRVVILSDPYVVTNSGIRLQDNLALAINILGGPTLTGLIAFDEYHQGRGITRNAFASYFAGTPVLAIGGQIILLVLVVLWTNGRRFGRPLPLARVDRRSSLEFVASMAELQERSRAFDLAIENIYSRTRRVLARHAGVDYNSSRAEIAERIAARSTIDRHELETLMRQCEDAINGAPINWRQSIHLVKRLREVERNLGLRMRSRDARQAAENI